MIAINYIATPEPTDILCGRGNVYAKHPGNIAFNETIAQSVVPYTQATSRLAKSAVVASVVSSLKSDGHRFIKHNKRKGTWYELDRDNTHEKVGHAIRDLVNKASRPGNKTKRTIQQATSPATSRKGIPITAPVKSCCNEDIVVDLNDLLSNPRPSMNSSFDTHGLDLFSLENESTITAERSGQSLCSTLEIEDQDEWSKTVSGQATSSDNHTEQVAVPAGGRRESLFAPLSIEAETQIDANQIELVLDCLGMVAL